VVNYLLKVVDHTTPTFDDISLTSLAAIRFPRSEARAHRSQLLAKTAHPRPSEKKIAISIQPQKHDSYKTSFLESS